MKKEGVQLEKRRLRLQVRLDADKGQAERNRLGQFATLTGLALDVLRYAKEHLGGERKTVRFTDPAIGTGSFYSALLRVFPKNRVKRAVGYEIDPHYAPAAVELWRETGLDLRFEDFTLA